MRGLLLALLGVALAGVATSGHAAVEVTADAQFRGVLPDSPSRPRVSLAELGRARQTGTQTSAEHRYDQEAYETETTDRDWLNVPADQLADLDELYPIGRLALNGERLTDNNGKGPEDVDMTEAEDWEYDASMEPSTGSDGKKFDVSAAEHEKKLDKTFQAGPHGDGSGGSSMTKDMDADSGVADVDMESAHKGFQYDPDNIPTKEGVNGDGIETAPEHEARLNKIFADGPHAGVHARAGGRPSQDGVDVNLETINLRQYDPSMIPTKEGFNNDGRETAPVHEARLDKIFEGGPNQPGGVNRKEFSTSAGVSEESWEAAAAANEAGADATAAAGAAAHEGNLDATFAGGRSGSMEGTGAGGERPDVDLGEDQYTSKKDIQDMDPTEHLEPGGSSWTYKGQEHEDALNKAFPSPDQEDYRYKKFVAPPRGDSIPPPTTDSHKSRLKKDGVNLR